MKITKLKMNAFGPFKGYEKIDFSKLNEKGIFLLTGKTGAGKTSIFDAICYCLYSETSSSNGSDGKVRSDYADDDSQTYVELDFEVKGVKYNLKRFPTQKIMGKRGTIIEKNHEVYLSYDNQILTNIKQVNSKIVEILGLNAVQFKQIVMIPQGEFMKLLLASSENKVLIFRKLFNTQRALDVEEKLREMSKEASIEVSEIKNEISMQFKSANINDDGIDITINQNNLMQKIDDKKNELEELINDCKQIEVKISDMEENYDRMKNVNLAIQEYKKAKEVIDEMNLSYKEFEYKKRLIKGYDKAKMMKILEDEINSLIEKNEQIDRTISNYNIELNNANKNKANLEEKRKSLESKKVSIESLKRDLYNKEDQLGKFNTQIGLKKQIEKLDEFIKNEKNKLDELKKGYNELNIKIDQKNNEIGKEQKEILDLYDENSKKVKIETNLNSLKDLKRDFVTLDEISNNIDIYEKKIRIKKLEMLKSKEVLAHKERIFYESQAGFLAINLKEGEPCPVCGSCNHPNKAKLPIEAIDKEELDLLNENHKKIEDELTGLKTELGIFQNQEYQITKILAENKFVEDYTINADNINSKIKDLEDELNEINNISSLIDQKNKKINALEDEIKRIENEKIDYLNKIEISETSLNDFNVRYGVVESQLDSSILLNHSTLVQTIEDIKSRIKNYNEALDNNNEEISKVNILIEQIRLNIQNLNKTIENNVILINQKRVVFDEAMLNYSDYDEYKSSLLDDSLLKEYERYVNDFETKYNFNIELMNKNEIYKDEPLSKIDGIKQSIDQKREDLNVKIEFVGSMKKEITSLLDIYNRIDELKNKSFNKIKKYEIITRISNITNGSNSLKMSFEKYILAIYFEEVLVIANELLGKMTDNKYELIRRDYLSKGNALQGLDLDVYDYSTGKIRAINTLSGGEQFKASLSLALGLSESIRREKSIIEINTMFIDEGFGSLDSESISQAMDVLLSIKNQGRVIGIISHIDDLKERIEAKIVLEKNMNGSKIKKVE